MNRVIKKYDITQCALYKCHNKRRLEQILTLEKDNLKIIKTAIAYHTFFIPKKDGDQREITAPRGDLKLVQARILKLISPLQRQEWLISGEKGKCYINNGQRHQSCDYMLTIDIKKFYDNCKREPVYRFFCDIMKTSKDIAEILTDIVTYNGGIPTGCPTSQLIAFYAYKEMFTQISELTSTYHCTFSLYVDDMTFSSKLPIGHKALTNDIKMILRKYGHHLKTEKVKYYGKGQFKVVTGTVISNEHNLLVPNNLRNKIYDNFQKVKTIDTPNNRTAEEEYLLSSLKGQLQAAKNVEPSIFPEIGRLTQETPISEQSNIHKPRRIYKRRHKIKLNIGS